LALSCAEAAELVSAPHNKAAPHVLRVAASTILTSVFIVVLRVSVTARCSFRSNHGRHTLTETEFHPFVGAGFHFSIRAASGAQCLDHARSAMKE
jgi:hypothetical protein